jgi:hypothetical protein
MATYRADRAFTDHIHTHLALPIIYAPLGWMQIDLESRYAQTIDMKQGIDYLFRDPKGEIKHVQERFRDVSYQRYTDFTIRYRRDHSTHHDRHRSEYYKMQADYFVYGITNCSKLDQSACSGFVKYAVIDMNKIYDKIRTGRIAMRDNGYNRCFIEHMEKIVCPIKHNRDNSSSFFPIDIALVVRLWADEGIVLSQQGFVA